MSAPTYVGAHIWAHMGLRWEVWGYTHSYFTFLEFVIIEIIYFFNYFNVFNLSKGIQIEVLIL